MEGIRLSGEGRSLRRVSAYPASFNESKPMRRTPKNLTDVREELVEIQQEFGHPQKRIDAVRDCITDSLTRIFGEERPAFAALAEEELIERIAGRVSARLGAVPAAKKQIDNRYVREQEAAAFLGVSVFTLQSWRSRGEPSGLTRHHQGDAVILKDVIKSTVDRTQKLIFVSFTFVSVS
jgi:hypothetical protein